MATVDNINRSIEAVLDAVPAQELTIVATYRKKSIVDSYLVCNDEITNAVDTDGTTHVTVIPSPPAGYKYELVALDCEQPNVADVTIRFKYNVAGVRKRLKRFTLSEGDNLGFA